MLALSGVQSAHCWPTSTRIPQILQARGKRQRPHPHAQRGRTNPCLPLALLPHLPYSCPPGPPVICLLSTQAPSPNPVPPAASLPTTKTPRNPPVPSAAAAAAAAAAPAAAHVAALRAIRGRDELILPSPGVHTTSVERSALPQLLTWRTCRRGPAIEVREELSGSLLLRLLLPPATPLLQRCAPSCRSMPRRCRTAELDPAPFDCGSPDNKLCICSSQCQALTGISRARARARATARGNRRVARGRKRPIMSVITNCLLPQTNKCRTTETCYLLFCSYPPLSCSFSMLRPTLAHNGLCINPVLRVTC